MFTKATIAGITDIINKNTKQNAKSLKSSFLDINSDQKTGCSEMEFESQYGISASINKDIYEKFVNNCTEFDFNFIEQCGHFVS